jgi:F-type H+-transporting ATPase subunit gamma
MRTLAYLETRKLATFSTAEQAVAETIEAVAADFLSFHTNTLPDADNATTVYVLVGSERGFCGDFNRALVAKLDRELADRPPRHNRLIAIGHKLHLLLEQHELEPTLLDGPSVTEDVPAVLQTVIDELDAVHAAQGGFDLVCMFHDAAGVRTDRLLPPFEKSKRIAPAYSDGPLLNVPPQTFMLDLVDHYLLAALNHVLYMSLTVENQRRMTHLDRAVRHIDESTQDLARRCRSLRQEEIVEEIEVILLSATSFDGERQTG